MSAGLYLVYYWRAVDFAVDLFCRPKQNGEHMVSEREATKGYASRYYPCGTIFSCYELCCRAITALFY